MRSVKKSAQPELQKLLGLMTYLRKRCPWDKKQTHKSLIPYLIEEAYETVEAIEKNKHQLMKEELGDLLFQIVFHAELGREKRLFTFEEIAKHIRLKMLARHNYLFEKKTKNLKDHLKNWNDVKLKEGRKKSLLDGTPKSLPALLLAERYNGLAASVGYDWKNTKEALKKVDEELLELRVEIHKKKRRKSEIQMELGDLLFSITSLSRHLGLNAEGALKISSKKFFRRFRGMEREANRLKRPLSSFTFDELEGFYQKSKKKHG